MYASVADYPAIYDSAYRSRRGTHTSFDPEVLPPLLAAFCRDAGAGALLDVSGGNGRLAEALRALGLRTCATDIVPVPEAAILGLDLSRYAPAEAARIRQEAARLFAGAPHVTACLDVLEHIDREHVFAALRNLAQLTARFLVVSISTRPSSRDNLFHASVLPFATWMALFEVVGFRELPTRHFAAAVRHPGPEQGTADPLVARWRAADPFGDAREGEPRYAVLEKVRDAVDWTEAEDRIERMLDVAYRREKRRQFAVPDGERFVLNLSHVQDFSFFRVLLDVLPRGSLRVLLRPDLIPELPRRAIAGFLARTGVRTHVCAQAEDLPWVELAGSTLITAAESSASINHALGMQIVALARLHGCRTCLLQHGIWPKPFAGRIASFASDLVLTWGAAEERILEEGRHRIAGAEVPWGRFRPGQVRRIGSPRYTDQLLPIHPDGLRLRLGIERDRFASVALLATKNFSHRGGTANIDEAFLTAMLRLIEASPETLFILRPHPMDEIEDLAALRRDNVRLLDEVGCIAGDILLSRIMPLVDQVIAPISTVALDAAISKRPLAVYDAGQPREYQHLAPVSAASLPELLRSPAFMAEAAERTRRFRDAYAEAVDERFYERFRHLLDEPGRPEGPVDAALATTVSLTAEVERGWAERAALQGELEAATGRVRAAKRKLKRMKKTPSWRVTAPLRWCGDALRRVMPKSAVR